MEKSEYDLDSRRVLLAAGATIASALVAVLAVREVAIRVLHPNPAFEPLTLAPPIIDTTVCTVVAIFVFVIIAFYPNPVRTWRRVATLVLILSFLPDVLLATSHGMGGGWPESCVLMTMHVVVWAICITLLPAFALTKHARKVQPPDRPLSIL